MDLFGTLGLAGLALVDSTSIGTLVLPIVLLLLPNFRASRVVLYLLTISVFYFGVGIALLFGAAGVAGRLQGVLETPVAYGVQLVIGLGLFVLSWFVNPGKENAERAKQGLPPKPSRWERRLSAASGSAGVIGIALLAGLAELATMLPYLGAVGILTASGLAMPARIGLLAGYVVVMIAPALILLAIRLALGAQERLARIRTWVTRQAVASLPWVIGIVGFLLARDAAWRLNLFGSFGGSG